MPECMEYYKDKFLKHQELDYLRDSLGLQAQLRVIPSGSLNRLLLDDHLFLSDASQIYSEEIRMMLFMVKFLQ